MSCPICKREICNHSPAEQKKVSDWINLLFEYKETKQIDKINNFLSKRTNRDWDILLTIIKTAVNFPKPRKMVINLMISNVKNIYYWEILLKMSGETNWIDSITLEKSFSNQKSKILKKTSEWVELISMLKSTKTDSESGRLILSRMTEILPKKLSKIVHWDVLAEMIHEISERVGPDSTQENLILVRMTEVINRMKDKKTLDLLIHFGNKKIKKIIQNKMSQIIK